MNAQELVDTARTLVAGDMGCWRWMKVIQPATCDLPGWGFPRPRKPGGHTLKRCGKVTEGVLRTVFNQRVMPEGMILKPNMVLPGMTCPPQKEVSEVATGEQQYQVGLIDGQQDNVDEVADATVRCHLRAVPAADPGIAFL